MEYLSSNAIPELQRRPIPLSGFRETTLSGFVESSKAALWVYALATIVIAGCSPRTSARAVEAEGSYQPAFAYVYRCEDDIRVVVRVEPESVRLERELDVRTLPQVIAASGTRYSDGVVTFWSKGLSARYETPDEKFERCTGTPAQSPWEVSRLLGYDLRAIGQEPGWLVEVATGRRMHVLADYGEVEFFVDGPVRSDGPEREKVYTGAIQTGEVVLRVRETPCEDVMSGERFPLTATLQLEGRKYSGCARYL